MQLPRWLIRLLITSLFVFAIPASMAYNHQQEKKAQTPSQQPGQSHQPSHKSPQKPQKSVAAQAEEQPIVPAELITQEQIEAYVKHYAGFGMHRAGSKIDRRAATWIRKTLKKDKLKVSVETFKFRRPISRYAVVSMKVDRINSVILPGMPLFNAKPTNSRVSARLGFVGQDGTVPVIHIYVTPSSGNAKLRAKSLKEFKDAVKSGRYKAVIGVTQGGYAGLVPLAIDLNKRYSTPAMLMSSEIGNYAEIYAEINNPVKFLTRLRYENSKAENVIAKIEGSQPNLEPIVVIAPRSAWWYAAAERGTGVAAWLASAKSLVKTKPKRTIIFVSTTGQEFYSMGLKFFLQQHPELVQKAFAWIYVGANIGTNPEPHYIVQSSSRKMRRQVKRVFGHYDVENVRWLNPSPTVLPAFSTVFKDSNYSVIFAATNNKCARMTCDKWPSNVNVDATLKFSRALTTLIHQLASKE